MVRQVQRTLRWAMLFGVLALGAWALTSPGSFLALWMTPDQYGHYLFNRGRYGEAAARFDDPRWRGISLYASGDFTAAALYFEQYQDAESLLARANALAHAREYLAARSALEDLARRYPEHEAPAVNIPIIQALIDANQMLSESQLAESGDLSAEQDEGPRSSEGDERAVFPEREALSAGDFIADPGLREAWLRQVQRNPAEFLGNKFYQQLEAREGNRE